MMILSWAGERLDKSQIARGVDRKRLGIMVTQSIEEIHHTRVLHADLRMANMLWNAETIRVMSINFERSEMMAGFRQGLLTQTSPNRERKRCLSEEQALGKKGNENITDSKSQVRLRFMNEISLAQREIARQVGCQ
jgi:hypothetical protein